MPDPTEVFAGALSLEVEDRAALAHGFQGQPLVIGFAMYSVLTVHIHHLLDATNPDTDVQPYIWLTENFRKVDVSSDAKFQRNYRRYWQLNPARLSEGFLSSYFHLLQQSKDDKDVSVEAVARKLYATPSHGNARRTLQFSFSSKLVHTLRPRAPVYDSNVDAFFFFPRGPQKESVGEKLERLCKVLSFLKDEYQRVLTAGLLAQPIAQFRQRFDPHRVLTDEKVIDTLIWKFVTLLRSGCLQDGRVVYG